MSHRKFVLLGPVFLASITVLAACSGTSPKPQTGAAAAAEARQIIDRYIAETGLEQLLQHESMSTTATLEISGQRGEVRERTWAKAPDKGVLELDYPGQDKVRGGYDGKVGWLIAPGVDAQLLSGEGLSIARDQANFYGRLYRPEDLTSLTLKGRASFQGIPCHELLVVTTNGSEQQHYFAVETGLLVGWNATEHSPQGVAQATVAIQRYRRFGGILLPSLIETSSMGQKIVRTTRSVGFAPIDDAVFALPAEIAALVDKQ